ncbi:SMI1/KNR4 family protein [Angustibacter sp. McL0619]|uniref:SMI1/KNR4 family protein n=1 Tax=Angustibacter sp. McL0619 TaxID=3415676 RepID=UPI003CF5F719
MAADLGLRLSDELVTFYAWHDGFGASGAVPMLWAPVSLADGLENTAYKRTMAVDFARDNGLALEDVYPDTWLSPGSNPNLIGANVDLSGQPSDPSPVCSIYLPDLGSPDYFVALIPSWTEYVATWVELWDRGCYGWEDAGVTWRNKPEDFYLRDPGDQLF